MALVASVLTFVMAYVPEKYQLTPDEADAKVSTMCEKADTKVRMCARGARCLYCECARARAGCLPQQLPKRWHVMLLCPLFFAN